MRVALVHDYLTQRGGAERVVLAMVEAFPEAPLYVSLYHPSGTFPEFAGVDIRPLPINRYSLLRRRHRLALPVLASAFSRLRIDADLVLCSSSGWAHGIQTQGRKVVYCYTPARWLYQKPHYMQGRLALATPGLALLNRGLVRWDQRAAASADRYVVSSRLIRDRVHDVYGRESDLLPPPHDLDPSGPRTPVEGVAPGFVLCVSRLLPYKNVRAIVEAVRTMPQTRLVVVGMGPEYLHLTRDLPPNVRLLGTVSDDELRWLYANCHGLAAASFEDYGITPLEAAAFGKPSAVLRWGGFLDTVVPGRTGVMFDAPEPELIREALHDLAAIDWDVASITVHAASFGKEAFIRRLRALVDKELNGHP